MASPAAFLDGGHLQRKDVASLERTDLKTAIARRYALCTGDCAFWVRLFRDAGQAPGYSARPRTIK